jgi:hypothetical protein
VPKVITANRLVDGIVVYASRDDAWAERLAQAKVFASKADADEGLLLALEDAKRNLVVEPAVVEVIEDASGLRPATLRESIRAKGPTIDFRRRAPAIASDANPRPEHDGKEDAKEVLRVTHPEYARKHNPHERGLVTAANAQEGAAR